MQTESHIEAAAARAHEDAAHLYDCGFYCSEAILKVVSSCCGADLPDEALRMATGFGAGMGHSGGVCGALSGAVMALGLLAGRTSDEGPYLPATTGARTLYERFEQAFGSTSCADIVDPFGGMRRPGRHEHCRFITGVCAGWAVEIAECEGWGRKASSAA